MSRFEDELKADLDAREQDDLRRELRALPPHALDLASNDYLGLARHPKVLCGVRAALEEFGGGARASRLLGGHTSIHQQLEAALAAWKECESALVFPSGYHANLAVVSALARAGDAIFCDKRNHASLIDGCRLAQSNGAIVRYYGNSSKLESLLSRDQSPRRLILSDTVYSMDGDVADVPQLVQLARDFDAILLLDDAHGSGTLGARGQGAWKHFYPREAPRDVDVVQIGTLSKALGSQGGFVAVSQTVVDYLVNTARSFIYTTGLNPAACGAALSALETLCDEPQRVQKLRQNTQLLARGLKEMGFEVTQHPSPILAVIAGDAGRAVRWSKVLWERGVWCPAVRPPTVPLGRSRLRVTVSAALSQEDIARSLSAFHELRHDARF